MEIEQFIDITKLKDGDIEVSFKKSYNGAVLWMLAMGDSVINIRCDTNVLNKCVDAAGRYWAGE